VHFELLNVVNVADVVSVTSQCCVSYMNR